MSELKLRKLADYLWEIPRTGNMLAPARIYATEKMLKNILADNAPQQAVNVALRYLEASDLIENATFSSPVTKNPRTSNDRFAIEARIRSPQGSNND